MNILHHNHNAHAKPLVIALILTMAATFLLTACGGAATPSSTTGTTPTTTSTAPAQSTATTANAKTVQIKIVKKDGKFSFDPESMTITKGTQVVWTNMTQAPHTVTSDTNTFGSTSNLSENQQFMMTFTTAGTFAYHCNIHSSMKATITVTA